jgi:RNA polymerase sigma-70 factor, ECF subfamily
MTTPSYNSDEILAQASWIRKVVRSMLADQHLADDLAQDALEAGLRQGSEIRGSTRGWLYGVAKNLHRQFLRGQSRRESRERRVSPPEQIPDSQDLVERIEIMNLVEKAVLALPQTHRDLLILRYYEDLSVRKIASLQGAPIKTVESRLRRAQQLLRTQLQNRFGGDWAAMLLPLAASLPSAGLTISPVSIFLMSKFTKVAALLIVALIFGSVFWPDPAPISGSGTNGIEAQGNSLATATKPVVKPPSPSISEENAATTNAAMDRTAVTTGLKLRVVDEAGNGIPNVEILAFNRNQKTVGINVHSLPENLDGYFPADSRTLTTNTGSAYFADLSKDFSGILYMRADHFVWRAFSFDAPPSSTDRTDDLGVFTLEDHAGHYAIRLLDVTGNPLPGLKVGAHSDKTRSKDGSLDRQTLRSDANGLVNFQSLPKGGSWVACDPIGFVGWSTSLKQLATTPQAPIDVVLRRGASIPIKVVDFQNQPVAGAAIYLLTATIRFSAEMMKERKTLGFVGRTNAKGEFFLEGLSDSKRTYLRVISGAAWVDAEKPPLNSPLTLKLPEEFELSGQFELANGQPAKGAKISLIDVQRPWPNFDFSAELDAEGRFSAHLRAGEYGLEVLHKQGSLLDEKPIDLNRSIDLGVRTLPIGPKLTLVLVDAETNEAIQSAEVRFPRNLGRGSFPQPGQWKRVLASKRWLFKGFEVRGNQISSQFLFPDTHEFQISAPGYRMEELTIELLPDQPTTKTIAMKPSADLDLVLLDAGGKPSPYTLIQIVPEDFDLDWMRNRRFIRPDPFPAWGESDTSGKVQLINLSPGTWNIVMSPDTESQFTTGEGLPVGSVTLKRGSNRASITLPAEAELSVEIRADGIPIPDVEIRLKRQATTEASGFVLQGLHFKTEANGIARLPRIAVGTYQFSAFLDGHLPLREIIEIRGPSQRLTYDLGGTKVSGLVINGSTNAEVFLFQYFDQDVDLEQAKKELPQTFRFIENGIATRLSKYARYARQHVDAEGRFSFQGVEPGKYYLLARAPDHLVCDPIELEVSESGLDGLKLRLNPSATIVLTVTGMPELQKEYRGARFTPSVSHNEQGFRNFDSIRSNGVYTYRQIPTGDIQMKWRMLFRPSDESRVQSIPGATFDLQTLPGQTTQVEFDARSLLTH